MPHAPLSRALTLVALALALLLVPLFCLPTAAAIAADTAVIQPTLTPLSSVGALSAESAVLMDAATGQLLYEKNANARLPMASTTKIMTALCAVELSDVSMNVKVDARAVGIEGSSIYLVCGEMLTLEQLLYALLLESANDASVAIAIAVSGSVEAFAEQMNRKAAELGICDTHFENPHGLDAEEHYTTAHDLALVAQAALAHPTLRRIMSTRKITIPMNDTKGVRLLVNHNKMLRYYEGAIGVKTGYTTRSGRCLVSAAERDGLTLIAVTLNAPSDWSDHTKMLDAGFAAYERVTLCASGEFESLVPVTGGLEGYVIVRNTEDVALTLPRTHGSVRCTVELPRFLYAAVEQNETVGQLIFQCDTDGDGKDELLARVPMSSAYSVARQTPKTWLEALREWLIGLFS